MATRRAEPKAAGDGTAKATTTKARKAAAPKAKAAPKTVETNPDGTPVKKTRRVMGDRNWLAREIDKVLRKANGPVAVSEIVAKITNKEGEHPSSGAVAAALIRWSQQGYVTVTEKPLSFKAYAGKHKTGTLDAFLDASREARLKARRAAKAA